MGLPVPVREILWHSYLADNKDSSEGLQLSATGSQKLSALTVLAFQLKCEKHLTSPDLTLRSSANEISGKVFDSSPCYSLLFCLVGLRTNFGHNQGHIIFPFLDACPGSSCGSRRP